MVKDGKVGDLVAVKLLKVVTRARAIAVAGRQGAGQRFVLGKIVDKTTVPHPTGSGRASKKFKVAFPLAPDTAREGGWSANALKDPADVAADIIYGDVSLDEYGLTNRFPAPESSSDDDSSDDDGRLPMDDQDDDDSDDAESGNDTAMPQTPHAPATPSTASTAMTSGTPSTPMTPGTPSTATTATTATTPGTPSTTATPSSSATSSPTASTPVTVRVPNNKLGGDQFVEWRVVSNVEDHSLTAVQALLRGLQQG